MWRNLTRIAGLMVAAVLVGALPQTAAAGGIGFRNDLNTPIIVQGVSFANIKGQPTKVRGKPLLIEPGKTAWDVNVKPGDREIFIHLYDRQTNKLIEIGRELHPFMGQDIFFIVQPIPPPNPNMPPKCRLSKASVPVGEMLK